MEGVSIVDREALDSLMQKVANLEQMVNETLSELRENRKPYLDTADLMELTGFGKTWVNDNKAEIGFSKIGSHIRFKRKDVFEYMEKNYFKIKSTQR